MISLTFTKNLIIILFIGLFKLISILVINKMRSEAELDTVDFIQNTSPVADPGGAGGLLPLPPLKLVKKDDHHTGPQVSLVITPDPGKISGSAKVPPISSAKVPPISSDWSNMHVVS